MEERTGWIRLHRKTIDSIVFQEPGIFKLWMYCLMTANWKDKEWLIPGTHKMMLVKRGSFITGRESLLNGVFPIRDGEGRKIRYGKMRPTGMTVWRWLLSLREWNCITIENVFNRASVVSICNYSTYQDDTQSSCSSDVQPVFKSCSSDVQVMFTTKEGKEREENKEVKNHSRKRRCDRDYSADFEIFWGLYPKVGKVKKPDAWKAWQEAVERALPQAIIDGAAAYAASDAGMTQFAGHASTWLRADRWSEDPESWKRNGNGSAKFNTAEPFDLLAELDKVHK